MLLILLVFLFCPWAKSSNVSAYLNNCDATISQNWLMESAPAYDVENFFRQHGKLVLSFSLDEHGYIKRIKLKHKSEESLLVAAQLRFGQAAKRRLDNVDQSMIDALRRTSPLPAPPKELCCPRSMVAVFDPDRFNPICIMIDEHIPNESGIKKLLQ